jgi:EAL domain-containing protein (putative c-di-GMP-specific phosphodiesterase class I)
VDIKKGVVTGVEALARWPHPVRGMVSPVEFIPMVEESGLIRPFTSWVVDEALKQHRRWAEADMVLCVAVNLSARSLLDPGLPDEIGHLLEANQVDPEYLILEITESAVMSHPEKAIKILNRLNMLGIKLSIDDFGTGYSSLAYLKKFPVDELKIDSSFVFGMLEDDNDAVIVRSTIELAHNLGLKVVAEGVENRESWDLLVTLRCDIVQGYFFSRPQSQEELTHWLSNSPWGPNNKVTLTVV